MIITHSYKVTTTVLTCMIASCITLPTWASPSLQAEKSPPSKILLNEEQLRSFDLSLKIISSKAKITVIVESKPLNLFLTSKQLEDHKVSAGTASYQKWLQVLAYAYDYTVLPFGRNTIILRKKYTQPDDIPAVTLEECRLAVKDILAILTQFTPTTDLSATLEAINNRHTLVSEIFATLAPDQWEKIRDQSQGLPLSSLGVNEKEKIRRLSMQIFLSDPYQASDFTRQLLQHSQEPGTKLQWQKYVGIDIFGFLPQTDTDNVANRWYYMIPLNHAKGVELMQGTHAIVVTKEIGGSTSDPLIPPSSAVNIDSDSLPDTAPKPVLPQYTLGVLATRLNEGERNAALSNPVFTVADYLAHKPVLIYGMQYASAREKFDACASLYALRVITDENNHTIQMTRPKLLLTQDIRTLPEALRRAVPLPLLTAVQKPELDRYQLQFHDASDKIANLFRTHVSQNAAAILNEQIKMDKLRAQSFPYLTNVLPLQQAAIAILLKKSQPTKESKRNDLLVSELNDEEGAALAVSLFLVEGKSIIRAFDYELPTYMSRFDTIRIAGDSVQESSGHVLSFTVGTESPYRLGGLQQWFGYSNMKVKP